MKLSCLAVLLAIIPSTTITLTAASLMSGQPTGTEREIKRLNREWGEAVMRRDVEALGRLLSDDYTSLRPSGQIVNKAQEIAEIKASGVNFTLKSYRVEDVKVSVTGSRATVTGHAVLKATLEGEDLTKRYWYTRTFAKRRGRWRIIAAQMIGLPQGGKRDTYPQKVAAITGACSPAACNNHSNELAPCSSTEL
jgi:ketosteroid isomerase-like protein